MCKRDRLDAYLEVHEEFSQSALRAVSGKEIDALCQMVLHRVEEPLTPAQLVDAVRDQFGAVIDAANPARFVSTRMLALNSVGSVSDRLYGAIPCSPLWRHPMFASMEPLRHC